MKKLPDKKVMIPALLFLPIIAGILLFLALAALADDGEGQDECAQGPWVESDKRVYAGEYKDLSLMRKLKARSMLFAQAGQLDTVAVAYAFPYSEVIRNAQTQDATQAFADMILHGKVAVAMREADTLNLVESPYVFQAWTMSKFGVEPTALKWSDQEGEANREDTNELLQAWTMAWDAYSKDAQGVNWISSKWVEGTEGVTPAHDWKDIVLLSAHEVILGVCNEGRVITWDGAKPLPDIDTVAQELSAAE